MSLLGAIVYVLAVGGLMHWLGLLKRVNSTLELSRQSLGVVRDSSMDELQKEKALQRFALRLFSQLAMIVVASAIALIVPGALVFAFDWLGIVSAREILTVMSHWLFLVSTLVVGTFGYVAARAIRS